MTGKRSEKVLEWLLEFISDPTKPYDQRDIDWFIKDLSRNDWIKTSWDIFKLIIQGIQSESTNVSVCLSFPLRCYEHPKKAPNYFIRGKALSKSSPPGIYLIRGSYLDILKQDFRYPLKNYDKKYKGYHCYFIQQKDQNIYWRWIDIVYNG